MSERNKIRLGIIFGGKSGEHEVSLQSSYNVIKSIDKNIPESEQWLYWELIRQYGSAVMR